MKGKIKILRKKYLNKFYAKNRSALSITIYHIVKIYYSSGHYWVQVKILRMDGEFNKREVSVGEGEYSIDWLLKQTKRRAGAWAEIMVEQAVKDVKYFLDDAGCDSAYSS